MRAATEYRFACAWWVACLLVGSLVRLVSVHRQTPPILHETGLRQRLAARTTLADGRFNRLQQQEQPGRQVMSAAPPPEESSQISARWHAIAPDGACPAPVPLWDWQHLLTATLAKGPAERYKAFEAMRRSSNLEVGELQDLIQRYRQKLSEPEKLGKVKFGKDIDDKVKKGTLRRMETEGLHVQVGAGKKKQILDKYVPTELNHVNGAEKAKEHAKICTGYLDQVVAEFKTEMDKLTGLTRALTDYVPRRFKVVSSAQCDLDVMFQYNSLGTFDDLADFLSMPSPNRYHGEHVAQPVLFTSVASGETQSEASARVASSVGAPPRNGPSYAYPDGCL